MAGRDHDISDQEIIARQWWHLMANDQNAVENFTRFSRWCDEAPGNRDAFDRVSQEYQKKDTFQKTAGHLHRHNRRQPGWLISPRKIFWGALGAAMVGAAAFGALFAMPVPSDWQKLSLPDGSVASLAPGSDYDIAFNDAYRNIHLKHGSIVIAAAKDSRRPMQVITDPATVRVVGTKFAVSIIGDEVETSVQEGVVAVHAANASDGDFTLTPGQRLWVGDDHRAIKTKISVSNALEIIDGWQSFRNASVADVLDALSRHSGHRFMLSPTYHQTTPINGRFRLTTAAETIAVLRKIASLRLQPVTDHLTLVY